MKPMQGIQWVNCAFFTFVLTEWIFLLYTHTVCVWTQRTGHAPRLPHQTPPVSNGSPPSRATKNDGWNQESTEEKKKLVFVWVFFLGKTSTLFANATKSVSELVNKPLKTVIGTLYREFIRLTRKQSACAHRHRTFEKKINVAIIIYYVMLVY